MTCRVLHVFPESVLEPGQQHLGSTKDIRGRTQYFRERDVAVTELVHRRSATGLFEAVHRQDLSLYDVVLVEFPLSVRATSQLRRPSPRPMLLTRSANAELLHRIDWMRAMGPSVAAAKLAVRTVHTTTAEVWAGLRSDQVLSISAWEVANYWPRLGARRRVQWLPYYVPDDYLAELTSGSLTERENVCVCLTSTLRNPLIEDSVRGFRQAVASTPEDLDWRFVVTGDIPPDSGSRIESAGMLASPAELLGRSRAVALLSDYGYGFKTKLLDAVVAGNRILVTPGLRRRVPPELAEWTITVDLHRAGSFARALEEARSPLPAGQPNAVLKARHHHVLDGLLGLPDTMTPVGP